MLALLAALAPCPALADPVADFAVISEVMPFAQNDPDSLAAYAEGLVRHVAGRWVNFTVLANGAPAMPADLLGKACGSAVLTLSPASAFGLDFSFGNAKGAVRGRMQWHGGNDFTAVYDEATLRKRLFGDKADDIPAGVLMNALIGNDFLGRLTVLPYGRDLLVILREGAPAHVWGRCPA
jgi:hypothetical protein